MISKQTRFIVILCALAAFGYMTATSASGKTVRSERAEKKEYTKDEMIRSINRNLDRWGKDIEAEIPDLVRKTDEAGKSLYLYKVTPGVEKKFNQLDAELLKKLFNKVNNRAVVLNSRRINKQIENIDNQNRVMRQVQSAQNIPKAAVVPQVPKTPPSVYEPPRVPQTPPIPPRTENR